MNKSGTFLDYLEPAKEAKANGQISNNERGFQSYLQPKKEEGGLLGTPRQLGVYSQEAASQALGSFGNFQKLIDQLMSAGFSKIGAEGFAKKILENKTSLPTSDEIRDKLNEWFEGKFAPETEEEKRTSEKVGTAASIASPSIFGKGFSPIRAALSPIAQTAGEETAGYFTESPAIKKTVGTVASILPLVTKGQAEPFEKELQQIYETGKKHGLSDAEITPLLNLRRKKTELGSELSDVLTSSKSVLGKAFENIKNLPSMTTNLDLKNRSRLINEMNSIKEELSHIPAMNTEQKAAAKYIDEVIDGLVQNKGTTGKGLINLWQALNKEFGGTVGTKLEGLKGAIANSLNKADPKAAREYQNINDLWKRMKSFKVLDVDKLSKYEKIGGKAASALLGFHFGNIPGSILGFATEHAIEKISKKLLLDPNWQNITKTTMKAVVNESPKLSEIAFNQLKNKVKEELPEEYKEVKWDEIK